MISFKVIILLIFIIGLIIVVRETTKMTLKCPKNEIQYKYLPRNLDLDLVESKDVDNIFKSMFQDNQPWVGTKKTYLKNIRKIDGNNLVQSFN
jgi:hypothetical protein